MKSRYVVAFAMVLVGACGGGGEEQAGPKTAPQSSASVSAMPTTTASASASETPPPPPPKPSLTELEKKSVKESIDAFNAHDAKKLVALYAPDATLVEYGMGGAREMKGRDDAEKMYASLFTAFPDAKMGASRVFQDKDVVIEEFAWNGTNTGPMMGGGKATDKKAGVKAVSVQWFDDDGLVKREEVYMDDATVAEQLGVIKGKARPVADVPSGEPQWVSDVDDKSLEAVKASGWTVFYSKHDKKGFEGVITDDTVHADMGMPTDTKGKKALIAEFDQWHKVFPDLKAEIGDGWGFKDGWAAYKVTLTGTMKGAWNGMKPTGKPVTMHVFSIDQMKDGKIASSETYANGMEAVGQISPPKAPKAPAAPPAKGGKTK